MDCVERAAMPCPAALPSFWKTARRISSPGSGDLCSSTATRSRSLALRRTLRRSATPPEGSWSSSRFDDARHSRAARDRGW